MNIRTLVINALLASVYIVVTLLVIPFGFTHVQFRLSEIFNHFVVFNKKYFFGIFAGVFIANLFSPLGTIDLIFGVSHSVLSMGLIILLAKFIKNTWTLLILNTAIFTFNMFIIALELKLVFHIPFFFGWLTTAAGELVVMAVGIPIMYMLNKKLKFDKIFNV